MITLPKPFYYRRKLILGMIQYFGGKMSRTDFQKYLFLVSQVSKQKKFDFVPYKYGSFSFQSYDDLRVMQSHYKLIKDDNLVNLQYPEHDYFGDLKPEDQKAIKQVKYEFGDLHGNNLLRLVYKKYPYFAIKSTVAESIMDAASLVEINQNRPNLTDEVILYTIGYEGKSVDTYLNELLLNDVKVLIDVRNNARSMKYGFNGYQLVKFTKDLGIKYLHIPELGIESENRQSLNTQADYDFLFETFEAEHLPNKKQYLMKVFEVLKSEKRIALTCFEKDPRQCHRTRVAEAVTKLPNWKYEFKHI